MSLVILFTFSCSRGLPHTLVHLKHASYFVIGFGNGMKVTFTILSGYLVSELHVPQEHLLTIFLPKIIFLLYCLLCLHQCLSEVMADTTCINQLFTHVLSIPDVIGLSTDY